MDEKPIEVPDLALSLEVDVAHSPKNRSDLAHSALRVSSSKGTKKFRNAR